jgi:hypothetical protein
VAFIGKKQEPMLKVFQVHGKYGGSMKEVHKAKGFDNCEM